MNLILMPRWWKW